MAEVQTDLMDRVTGVIRRTIEARRADGDEVEWSAVLVPTYAECDEGHTEFEFVIGMHARVWCPEIETRMISNLMGPICADDMIAEWINAWWDRLTVERMAELMELEEEMAEDDTPGG